MDVIKRYWYVAVILIIIAAVIWFVPLGGCDVVKGLFAGKVDVSNPPPPSEVGIPEDADPVPVIEDKYTIGEKLNPFHETTRAEELTKDLPPGTEVYEVDGTGLIYRTPQGFIYERGEIDITAYRTPTPLVAAEFRPKVIGTASYLNAGLGIELDLLRIEKAHVGPAAGIYFDEGEDTPVGVNGWGGVGTGYNVWKNVDAGGYVGYGNDGYVGGISVGIAIE